jgi:hypothetical protein
MTSIDFDKRVEDAHRKHIDNASRFDYFVTGGAGVALGFALKEFRPTMGPAAVFLLPVAWATLLIALGAGMAQLDAIRTGLRYAHTREAALAEAQRLQAALRQNASLQWSADGSPLSQQGAQQLVTELYAEVAHAEKRVNRLGRKEQLTGVLRNVALMIGFGVLALWQGVNL